MEDAHDLIERLCIAAGMIIEDTAEHAVAPTRSLATAERIEIISVAGRDIQVISNAAAVIAARWG